MTVARGWGNRGGGYWSMAIGFQFQGERALETAGSEGSTKS